MKFRRTCLVVERSISEGRRVFRFFKFLDELEKLRISLLQRDVLVLGIGFPFAQFDSLGPIAPVSREEHAILYVFILFL